MKITTFEDIKAWQEAMADYLRERRHARDGEVWRFNGDSVEIYRA
jgi:hypothetical protein